MLKFLGFYFTRVCPKTTLSSCWIFCDLILYKYCPSWEPGSCFAIPVTKIHKCVMDFLAKFKHIKSGRSGWNNQLRLERKFTLNKSLIWSRLTSPPRKKTVELWSGHWLRWNSCWANRKVILESRAPGFTVRICTHSESFHAFSAYYISINIQ